MCTHSSIFLVEELFLFAQIWLSSLKIIVKSIESVNFNEYTPKIGRHEICFLTDPHSTSSARFVRINPIFLLLVGLLHFIVDSYFVHDYETEQVFVRIAECDKHFFLQAFVDNCEQT